MNKKAVVVAQIAATYIGTVVGAGFATGQEILQFFTIHGMWGLVGIMISSLLFVWLGTRMMIVSHRIKAYSYQEFNNYLFGKKLGAVVNTFVFVVLFGVTAVMLSGAGAIFEEQWHLPYQVGIIVTIVLCYIVMLKGINGIFLVNSLVVPLMLLFSFIVAVKVGWSHHDGGLAFGHLSLGAGLAGWDWLLSTITYVAFNLAMAQAVLVPLGREIEDENLLKWGGFWGGIGLGFMLMTTHIALQPTMPDVLSLDIPMAIIIQDIGALILLMFLLVIYGEIFTTLIGNVFGIARQVQQLYSLSEKWLAAFILLASFIISQIGFSSLVSHLYPLFGYMGIGLLIYLAVKKLPQ